MITRGIVEEIVDPYSVKVRMPALNRTPISSLNIPYENLNTARICTMANCDPNLRVGDVVFVGFEDNNVGKPVILGYMYRDAKYETYASARFNSLQCNLTTKLSADTTIGQARPVDFENLSGTRSNLQSQIDLLNQRVAAVANELQTQSSTPSTSTTKSIYYVSYGNDYGMVPVPGQSGIFFSTQLIDEPGLGKDDILNRLQNIEDSRPLPASGWIHDSINNYVLSIVYMQGDHSFGENQIRIFGAKFMANPFSFNSVVALHILQCSDLQLQLINYIEKPLTD